MQTARMEAGEAGEAGEPLPWVLPESPQPSKGAVLSSLPCTGEEHS